MEERDLAGGRKGMNEDWRERKNNLKNIMGEYRKQNKDMKGIRERKKLIILSVIFDKSCASISEIKKNTILSDIIKLKTHGELVSGIYTGLESSVTNNI